MPPHDAKRAISTRIGGVAPASSEAPAALSEEADWAQRLWGP